MDNPERTVLLTALAAGFLLLVAPFAPPQAAIYAFLGLLAMGLALLFGYRAIRAQLADLYPDEPADADTEEDTDPVDEIHQQYLDGEITEEELEEQLDKEMEVEFE